MDLSPLLPAQSRRLAPPKRRSKRKRDRVAKQEALIRAATKLFASKGYHVTVTAERLRRHRKKGTEVSDDDLDAISQANGALGFSFGFMRPVVFGLDTRQARNAASCVARILTRGLEQR